MTAVADYSWARPAPAALAAAGYAGVMRYLSGLPSNPAKNLAAAERDGLHAAGLGIGLVWETTAGRALAGADAGAKDGQDANRMADTLGFPAALPLYYAVDVNVNASHYPPIVRYFEAAARAGRQPRVYGEAGLIDHLVRTGVCDAGWQAASRSWSGGETSAHAVLVQRVGQTRGIAGIDHNDAFGDWGGWFPARPVPQTPATAGPTVGSVTPLAAVLEDDMLAIVNDANTTYLCNGIAKRGIKTPADIGVWLAAGAVDLRGRVSAGDVHRMETVGS